MDMSELAALMLEWENTKKRLAELEAEIIPSVLAIGKTQTVGNVRASYRQGSKSYDYETPGKNAHDDVIAAHTETKITTNWKAVCEAANMTPMIASQSAPSVSVKLV